MSCSHSQGLWVGENLGPTIRKSEFKDVKLFAGDDQRYTFPWWFNQMNRGFPNATDYIDGYAVHWYWDVFTTPSLLDLTYQQYPDKIILNTESCLGDKPFDVHGPILGSWERGESYINGIFQVRNRLVLSFSYYKKFSISGFATLGEWLD